MAGLGGNEYHRRIVNLFGIMLDTAHLLLSTDFPAPRRILLTTLQVNLGYRCNQSNVLGDFFIGAHARWRVIRCSPGMPAATRPISQA